MTPWERNDGSLHLYALPDDAVADRLSEAQGRLDGLPNLPLMPRPWLHFTVQRLAQFDDIGQAELSRLCAALGRELDDLAPFDLDLGSPQVHEVAVEVLASPSPGWDALVDAVRRAVVDTFGDAMPERPYAPHVSLAYATGEVDDETLRSRLADTPAVGRLRVDSVGLMSVTVRPEVGTFDWVELAGWSLG